MKKKMAFWLFMVTVTVIASFAIMTSGNDFSFFKNKIDKETTVNESLENNIEEETPVSDEAYTEDKKLESPQNYEAEYDLPQPRLGSANPPNTNEQEETQVRDASEIIPTTYFSTNGSFAMPEEAEQMKQQMLQSQQQKNVQMSDNNQSRQQKQAPVYDFANMGHINIAVNRPISLTGMTKNEVFAIRKQYVGESIFKSPYYEPAESVFGGIEDYKPWVSTDTCMQQDGMTSITGNAEESRFIVNPSVLVSMELGVVQRLPELENWCNQNQDMYVNATIPTSIEFSGTTKTLTVNYPSYKQVFEICQLYSKDGGRTFTEKRNCSYKGGFSLNFVNAKDFGYNYIYLDENKSILNDIRTSGGIATNAQKMEAFIHLGGSCGHPSGCNNGSPAQDIKRVSLSESQPGYNYSMYFKLWKEQPASPNDAADFIEIINFSM